MTKVKVYGSKTATCTQRILILLEELELDYELINIDLTKGEQKTPAFMTMQPFGKIPAIKIGRTVLFESRAILRYLAKNATDKHDLTLNDNVNVEVWLEAESQNFNPPISKIVYEKIFKKMSNKKEDASVVAQSLEDLKKVLEVYEKRLEKNHFMAGRSFSIVDISHIPYTKYFINSGYEDLLKNDYPHFYKWFLRVCERNSVKKILS